MFKSGTTPFTFAAIAVAVLFCSSCAYEAAEPVWSRNDSASQQDGVQIDRDRVLRGRVLDPRGKPLVAAELQLVQLKWRGHTLEARADFEASREHYTTDALGEFTIPLEKDKEYDLTVSHGELAPREILSLYAGAFVEVVLQHTATFAGRVVAAADGSPIAATAVRGWSTRGRIVQLFSGETDSEGRFRFTGLPPGSVRVQVIPLKHALPAAYVAELVGAKTTTHEFRCVVGYRLTGKVTDANKGTPIPGATVGQGSAFSRPTQTDSRGEYEIMNFANNGGSEIFVRATGYGLEVQQAPSGSDQATLNFELRASREVTGQVFRPDGDGAAGVNVAAITAALPREPDILNWYPGEVRPDGSFVIEGLQWGAHYAIVVRSAEFARVVYELPQRAKRVQSFALSPIQLSPPATVRGTVRNETGEPLPGVWVYFRDHNRNPDRFRYTDPPPDERGQQTVNETYSQIFVRTDDLGRFTLTHLRPGPAYIDVFVAEHYMAPRHYVADNAHAPRLKLHAGQELSGVEVVVSGGGD